MQGSIKQVKLTKIAALASTGEGSKKLITKAASLI
jgi:hypothetical protein